MRHSLGLRMKNTLQDIEKSHYTVGINVTAKVVLFGTVVVL